MNDSATASPGAPEELISLRDVNSAEHRRDSENGAPTPVLRGVTLTVRRGEILGIIAKEQHEAQALCEIMGNMKPYYSGWTRIGRIGTMQVKRLQLPFLFYIDTPDMLDDSLSLLDMMTAATEFIPPFRSKSMPERMELNLSLIETVGLSSLALTALGAATKTEKIIAELLLAALSGSEIIVVNSSAYSFAQAELEVLRRIVRFAAARKKTLIFAASQPKLIGMCCSHAALICDGTVKFSGSVARLRQIADDVIFALTSQIPDVVKAQIETAAGGLSCEVIGNNIYVHNNTGADVPPRAFFRMLSDNNIVPDSVRVSKGHLENAVNRFFA